MLSGFFQSSSPAGRNLLRSLDEKGFYCICITATVFHGNGENSTENVIDVCFYLFKNSFICPSFHAQFLIALAAQGKLESSSQAERAASESFALATAKYEHGKASITEFNESKNQYLKACSDLAQARYEYLYQTRLLDFYRGRDLTL